MRAKFKCESVLKNHYSEEVTLNAVSEAEWSKWTPSGTLKIQITNPELFGKIEPGKDYYIDLKPVEQAA